MKSSHEVMDLSSIEKIKHELHLNVANKVTDNLFSFCFGHYGFSFGDVYLLISEELSEIINAEIMESLTIFGEYTKAQKLILQNFNSPEIILSISHEIAGKIVADTPFNFNTGTGLNCTGLTKVYYDFARPSRRHEIFESCYQKA